MTKIGVFDSGIGGLSVAHAIQEGLPECEVLFTNDEAHVPYGIREPEELLELVTPILEGLVEVGCELIVIACNTVSTTLIDQLRERIEVPLIALEPMVKPAAKLSKTGVIAVCATPTTLKSKRYEWLKDTYAQQLKVVEPDCSDWSSMIESNNIDREQIRERIEAACSVGADVIVLGCTHYHWIEEIIDAIADGRAAVIQPEEAIVKQVKRVLATLAPPA